MNELVLTLIVILIPGIVAAIVSDKLTNHSKWNSFKFCLYAFILGVVSYAFLQIISYIITTIENITIKEFEFSHLGIWDCLFNNSKDIDAIEICLATLIAIPVAYFVSTLVNRKVFNKVAQKIGVTTKYGDENLYSFYLNAKEIDWIYVRDPENNLTYQGRIIQHSENDDIQEIVLSEVSIYRYEDSEFLYSVPTIYLSKTVGKFIIEAIPKSNLGGSNE